MSENTFDTFFTFETLVSFKSQPLDEEDFHSVKILGQLDDLYYLGIKRSNDQWDLITYSSGTNCTRIIFSHLKSKPLHVNPQHDLLLSHQEGRLLCTPIAEPSKTLTFPLAFKPLVCLSLPSLEATLLLSSSPSDFLIFMNSQRQPLNQRSQSLTRALASVSRIDSITTSNDESFAIVDGQQVKAIGLIESREQEGKKEFRVIQKMQVGEKIIGIKMRGDGQLIIVTNSKIIIKLDNQSKEITHHFNLFRPKEINIKDDQITMQDKTGAIYVFNEDSKINHLLLTSDNQKYKIFKIDIEMFAISQSMRDKSQFNIEKIKSISVDELLTKLLENDEGTYTALQIMRATGFGQEKYLKYQLNKKGFSEVREVQEYLQISKESSKELLNLLMSQKNLSPEVFKLFLTEALIRCPQDDPYLNQTLLLASSRFRCYLSLVTILSSLPDLSVFCLSLSTADILSALLLVTSPDSLPSTLTQLQTFLDMELAQLYPAYLFDLLPLEHLPAAYILKHLLPNQSKDSFFAIVTHIHPEIIDTNEVYMRVCQMLIDECGQPGKALVIAQEAAQRRSVKGMERTGWLAVKEVFRQEYKGKKLKEVLLEDPMPVKIIQGLFEQAKWIFVMDNSIYQDYLQDLSDCLQHFCEQHQVDPVLQLLQSILEHHATTSLLCLHDADLAQITLALVYSAYAGLSTQHSQLLSNILALLSQMTNLTPNQSLFLKRFLTPHLSLQTDIIQNYSDVELTYNMLLKVMTSTDILQVRDCLEEIVRAMVDSQVRRSRKLGSSYNDKEIWVQTLEDVVSVKQMITSEKEEVDVYSMFIKRLLENRVTASIEQMIKLEIMPRDQVLMTVLKYLQDQYNQCDSERFYSFAQNSKQFLELLKKYDNQRKYQDRINQELKLIECSFFLKQNRLLIDSLPKSQIRSDFVKNRLIERVLQVHGFLDYPDSFQQLAELQQIIAQDQIHQVIVKVLKHLNSIRVFESGEYKPSFTQSMIEHLFLNRTDDMTWLSHDSQTGDILYKIALISSEDPDFKTSLLRFLLTYLDKRSDTFYFLCRQLADTLQRPQSHPVSFLESLQSSLDHGLLSKASQLIKKTYGINRALDLDLFFELASSLTYSQMKLLAKRVFHLNKDFITRLKSLEHCDEDRLTLLRDDNAYSQWLNKHTDSKRMKIIVVENPVQDNQSGLIRMLQVEENEDVTEDMEMMIEMEYTDWQGQVDIDKIIAEMKEEGVKQVSQKALKVIIDKINGENREKLEIVIKESSKFKEINPLLIIKDVLNPGIDHANSIMTENQTELISEFRAVVTDMNIIKLAMALEIVNESYSSMLALCLYANKLELCIKNEIQISFQLFYKFVDKDVLEEMIDNNENIQKLNSRVITTNRPLLKGVMI